MYDILIALIPAFLGALIIWVIRAFTRLRWRFYTDFMERRIERRRHPPKNAKLSNLAPSSFLIEQSDNVVYSSFHHTGTFTYSGVTSVHYLHQGIEDSGIYMPIARQVNQEDLINNEDKEEQPKPRRFIDIGRAE